MVGLGRVDELTDTGIQPHPNLQVQVNKLGEVRNENFFLWKKETDTRVQSVESDVSTIAG